MTSREEFEAGVWSLLERHKATLHNAWLFVDCVLSLADAYGSGDDEKLTALRREVLHRETAPNAHRSASDCGGDR